MGEGNSCYFQSRGRAGPIPANMTNVGDCRDAHGASQGHIRVGESWVIPQWGRGTSRPCLGMSFCHCKGWSRGVGRGGGRVMGPLRRSGGTSNAKMVTCVISGRGQYTSRVPLARTAVCLILPPPVHIQHPPLSRLPLGGSGTKKCKIFCCNLLQHVVNCCKSYKLLQIIAKRCS